MSKILETETFLRKFIQNTPDALVVLGSGLGGFVQQVEILESIPYKKIPNFPQVTVEGHGGNLIVAKIQNKHLIILQGRFHYYEGYDLSTAVYPLKVLHQFGIKNLLISNAAGGINPAYKPGDIMIIKDHIHFFPDNPLRGKNDDTLGPRFPDMSLPYSRQLIDKAIQIAHETSIVPLHQGVYFSWQGPTYETVAEYKMIKFFEADAVGMSSTYEVIMGNYLGWNCFGVSVITNVLSENPQNKTTHDEVKDVSSIVQPKLGKLFKNLVLTM